MSTLSDEAEPREYGICVGAMPAGVYDTILEVLAEQTQELIETVHKVERLRAHGVADDRLLPYELNAPTSLAAVQGAAEWLMYTMQGLEIEPGGWLEWIGASPPTPSASRYVWVNGDVR